MACPLRINCAIVSCMPKVKLGLTVMRKSSTAKTISGTRLDVAKMMQALAKPQR